ncbi:MAG: nucleotidyltransferase domain-containing protein [Haliscomenobacteraceae bacterium CHB4]|nr:hypothetical protein [Saprospiraceae bacterium]MCE7925017.1 nucleotidyltransferase domain-containing protein [Haliscomenobacteraceae bacterium CHB4]
MVTPEQIAEIVHILSTRCNPEKIILFGSYAQGTANEESDLDLAIVKKTDLPKYQRSIEFLKALREGRRRWLFPMDIIVYTPEEIEMYRDNQYSLIHEIVLTGKVLYESKRPERLAS